jgi:lactam utilization protein B
LMQEGCLIDVNQQKHAVDAHTFCVHSDHPNTQHILQTIHGA